MTSQHVDVLIVGAGLSGIGAARHLTKRCPAKSYVILEGRAAIGGTWDLFRYPGVRSDSDMFTLGYAFKPWTEAKAIADGPSILNYVRQTAAESGADRHIKFNHQVKSAAWSSRDARWTVEAVHDGAPVTFTCNFLLMCAGYYRYGEGYAPEFPGMARFAGPIVHPQKWPENLDYAGKRVVVIGSGATAVTLVPAMAEQAAHVVMLQRSPTYMFSMPARDGFANFLRRILPAQAAYEITRFMRITMQQIMFKLARARPARTRARLIEHVRERLGADYDVARHFTPSYNPWDQRLCLVPDDDLFTAIRDGKASVVTDTIDTFTERGIKLASDQDIEADIIVTATGLVLEMAGGATLSVDGRAVNYGERFTYKGMMLNDVPNFAQVFGYTNASWTLRADLVCEYVCRLINHMDRKGLDYCAPHKADPSMEAIPYLDFSSGYVQRAMQTWPKQGARAPWRHPQDYGRDMFQLRFGALEDGVMAFRRAGEGAESGPAPQGLAAAA